MQWLDAQNVADAIGFTESGPTRVNLQQITIMPTGQPM
jgi:NADP-dependent 3-hydroxy acid dehydrogenase YdfG